MSQICKLGFHRTHALVHVDKRACKQEWRIITLLADNVHGVTSSSYPRNLNYEEGLSEPFLLSSFWHKSRRMTRLSWSQIKPVPSHGI